MRRAKRTATDQVAAETGLIGILVFGWVTLTLVAIAWSLWRGSGPEWRFGALVLASGAAFAVSNFFATVAFQSVVSVYFWMMIGLAGRAWISQRETAVPRPVRHSQPAYRRGGALSS